MPSKVDDGPWSCNTAADRKTSVHEVNPSPQPLVKKNAGLRGNWNLLKNDSAVCHHQDEEAELPIENNGDLVSRRRSFQRENDCALS